MQVEAVHLDVANIFQKKGTAAGLVYAEACAYNQGLAKTADIIKKIQHFKVQLAIFAVHEIAVDFVEKDCTKNILLPAFCKLKEVLGELSSKDRQALVLFLSGSWDCTAAVQRHQC